MPAILIMLHKAKSLIDLEMTVTCQNQSIIGSGTSVISKFHKFISLRDDSRRSLKAGTIVGRADRFLLESTSRLAVPAAVRKLFLKRERPSEVSI